MAEAIFVRVEAERTADGGRTFQIWIVPTADPDEAVKAVKEMVSPNRNVEAIHDRPSEETIKTAGASARQSVATVTPRGP
jgi:hypothetical protein